MPILSAQASHTLQVGSPEIGRGTLTLESYWPELRSGLCYLPCVTSSFLPYRVGSMFMTPAS